MLFTNCESCNDVGAHVCRCESSPRFFCGSHLMDHVRFSGIHATEVAVKSLSPAQVSIIREAYTNFRLSSLRQAIQIYNSRVECLHQQIRIVKEEYFSTFQTILNGPIIEDIQEVLNYKALPLFCDSSVVRSLLDFKDTPNFSSSLIHDMLISLNSSLQSSFRSSRESVRCCNDGPLLNIVRAQRLVLTLGKVHNRILKDAEVRIVGEGYKVKGAINSLFTSYKMLESRGFYKWKQSTKNSHLAQLQLKRLYHIYTKKSFKLFESWKYATINKKLQEATKVSLNKASKMSSALTKPTRRAVSSARKITQPVHGAIQQIKLLNKNIQKILRESLDRWKCFAREIDIRCLLDNICAHKLKIHLESVPTRRIKDALQQIIGQRNHMLGILKNLDNKSRRVLRDALRNWRVLIDEIKRGALLDHLRGLRLQIISTHIPTRALKDAYERLNIIKTPAQTSSTQTHPPSNVSVQTSCKLSLSTQLLSSQIHIRKPIDPRNTQWTLSRHRKAHEFPIYSIAVSDCERYLASASGDKTIKIWELQTLRHLRTLKGHTDFVFSVRFIGNRVLSGSLDTTIKLWEEARCIKTLKKHSEGVFSVCASSCKRLIVSGSGDNTAVVLRLEDNRTIHTLDHLDGVSSVVFSPNDKEIVSGCNSGKISLWKTETGELLKTLNANSGCLTCVNFSGNFIVSSSRGRIVRIWDRDSNQPILTFADHTEAVSSVDVSDSIVASLGHDDRIVVRDVRSSIVIQTLQAHGTHPTKFLGYTAMGLKVLEGAIFIVSGGADGKINVWKMDN